MRLLVVGQQTEELREFFRDRGSAFDVHYCDPQNASLTAAQWRPEGVILQVQADDREAVFHQMAEVTEVSSARILALGPTQDAKYILRILREGAFQYVDEAMLEGELQDSLRKLREAAPISRHQGHVISVVGVSGGVGATTVATNIATSYAMKGRATAVMDLRLDSGDVATFLNLTAPNSIADFCSHVDRMDQSMFEHCLATHSSGVQVMAAPERVQDVRKVTLPGLRRALKMAREKFDYIVVDLDRPTHGVHNLILFQSDVVVLVLRQDIASIRQARRQFERLTELGIPQERIRAVVSRFNRRSEISIGRIRETLGLTIVATLPDDPKRAERAINHGTPIVIEIPRSPIAQSLRDVAIELNGKFEH